MMKRVISLMLTAALLIIPASAADTAPESERAQVLALLEIMQGNEHGDLQLTRTVTRAEFCKLAIAASVYKDTVGAGALIDPYPDVPRTHWAAPYVRAARDTGLVVGKLDGTFAPDDTITLAEGATIVLRLLGYSDNNDWPVAQMARYAALGLDDGVAAKSATDTLTRRDALNLFYNLLLTKTQTGAVAVYIQTLGYGLNAFGLVDVDALLAEGRSAPFVADLNWRSAIPFAVTSVTRDGHIADPSAVQPYDVVYYNDRDNSVEVYSDKVTGTLSAVSPNLTNPTSVTVLGANYALETQEMVAAFGTRGTWRRGDVVTLLLGRGGGVAGVVSAGEHSAAVYGMVAAIASTSALDAAGNAYAARTVTILGTDGVHYPFVWADDNVEIGDLASGQHTATGPVVTKLSTKNALPAGYTIASTARILDIWGNSSAAAVYPSRLSKVRLTSDMVRWFAATDSGEITDLILKDVTGDGYKYGVITKITENTVGMNSSGIYEYDAGGVPGVYSSSKVYYLDKVPVQVRSDKITPLRSVELLTPDGTADYPAAETVYYYEQDSDGNFTLSSHARLSAGNFTLTGWYDAPPSQGGLIRVIVGA